MNLKENVFALSIPISPPLNFHIQNPKTFLLTIQGLSNFTATEQVWGFSGLLADCS